jgi:hypothetical protein
MLGLTDNLTPSKNAKPNLQSPEKEPKIISILAEIKAGRRKGGGVHLVLFSPCTPQSITKAT